jgi:hypothetical protein
VGEAHAFFAAVDRAWAALRSARPTFYGRFVRVERGVYALSDEGHVALSR